MDDTTRSVLKEAERVSTFHQKNKEAMEDVNRRFHCSVLFEEFHILDRLMYKYHNQQRRHVHYRRLRLLRRRLQRVHKLLLYTHWAVIMKNAVSETNDILHVLYDHIQHAIQDCLSGYEAVYAVLQDLLYVPFAMMCVGALAKIFSQLRKLSQIVNAIRLDIHAGHAIVCDTDKCDNGYGDSGDRHERMESGWESSTTEQKQRQKRLRYVKKVKRPRGDEIDDIFKD